MPTGYRCRHFSLPELVGPEIFRERGERCWEMFNVKALIMLDTVRARFGPISINTWNQGGPDPRHESGARAWDTKTGAKYSMHKLWSAFDMHFQNADPREVQAAILKEQVLFAPMTCMEDATKTVTWLHGDVRNHGAEQQIIIVQP